MRGNQGSVNNNTLSENQKLEQYALKVFPGRIPKDAEVIWELYNEKDGLTTDRYGYGQQLRVNIPKSEWFKTNRTMLNVIIDHELFHVDDYASGKVWIWEHQFRKEQTLSVL